MDSIQLNALKASLDRIANHLWEVYEAINDSRRDELEAISNLTSEIRDLKAEIVAASDVLISLLTSSKSEGGKH